MLADQENTEIATSVGVIPDWRKAGPVREIPYGALIPQGVRGLLVVGRCISAEGEAWEVARVIPPAVLTGQLAGIAAILAIRHGTTPDALVVDDIQTVIQSQGLPLHASDIDGLDL
ncbi:MAG: FAD-dependent oxidoreductase, partial [Anaerolineae bacterium]|nr:FAD-dependent oxidoreductase [Anaerolineae bacterium]